MSVIGNYKNDLGRAVPTIDTAFVGKLLGDVLGVESPIYLPTWWKGRDYKVQPYTDVEVDDVQIYANPDLRYQPPAIKTDDEFDADAPIRYGQKVFGSFFLKGGQYKRFDFDGRLITRSLPDFVMPLATIVDFDRPKIIKKTPTLGGLGSIKEIYGLGDWDVSINGIIIPDDLNQPAFRSVAGQMEAIQAFHEIAGSFEVYGQIFMQRNIVRLVTEELKFSPIQGKPNMMQYSIKAISDEDLLITDVE